MAKVAKPNPFAKGNPFAKAATMKADKMADKKKGIKEGSKKDLVFDKKKGFKD